MEMYEKTLQLQKLRQGGDAKQFARNDKGELYSISRQDMIEMLREELGNYGRGNAYGASQQVHRRLASFENRRPCC